MLKRANERTNQQTKRKKLHIFILFVLRFAGQDKGMERRRWKEQKQQQQQKIRKKRPTNGIGNIKISFSESGILGAACE